MIVDEHRYRSRTTGVIAVFNLGKLLRPSRRNIKLHTDCISVTPPPPFFPKAVKPQWQFPRAVSGRVCAHKPARVELDGICEL